ncbi:MAG TPA: 16S rRNA (uracil(1498)-N(3))-methyltransferase [Candidatus Binatia bacterium]|jgi:16S rRNA (uracil1498-N3)-methyltransferase
MGDLALAEAELTVARFFVAKKNIHGGSATIAGPELNHMRKALRLGPGDRVILFDDEGWEHEGIIRSYDSGLAEITLAKSSQPERESPVRITLAQALGKGDKLDWVVEKATELGVRAIVPFLCRRTVPKLDGAAAAKRGARWQRIALSAAKQSGRTRVPEILGVMNFSDLVQRPWPCDLKLIFWENETVRGLRRLREEKARVESLILVIGPEGGFTSDEVAEATGGGFQSVGMGKRILRTETAAVAALSSAQLLWGDLG